MGTRLGTPLQSVAMLTALVCFACGSGSTDVATGSDDNGAINSSAASSDSVEVAPTSESDQSVALSVTTGTVHAAGMADGDDGGGDDSGADSETMVDDAQTTETTQKNTVCVTSPTTIPGDTFCDDYQPFPDNSGTRAGCPDWAVTDVARPTGGWLGVDDSGPNDGLWRQSIDSIGSSQPLDDFAQRATAAAPTSFVLVERRARAAVACVDESLILGLTFNGADDAVMSVVKMRLIGQVDWFQEGYPPNNRSSAADGTEFASHDGSSVVKVWMASPDGTLIKISAYGANADRKVGFPTTTTTFGTSLSATPLNIDADDLLTMARAIDD